MGEISLEEAEKTAKEVFPDSEDAGEIQDIFYGKRLMVIHTTTQHTIIIRKEEDVKRLMTACTVILNKVEALRGI